MSIPHSKVLSVSKGFGLGAEFHNNSPTSTQVVNVNINKNTEREHAENNKPTSDPAAVSYAPLDSNPYNNLSEPPAPAPAPPQEESKNNELQELLQYKDNVIEALSSLLKIVESNPLIINKLIVASIEDLASLIKLL